METVDIPALLREYESAVENREEDDRNQGTRGRANKAAAALVAAVEELRKSERYAWKNTHNLDGERMRFRAALEEIASSKQYIDPRAIAIGALSESSDSAEAKPK